jgi:hypothetical protein
MRHCFSADPTARWTGDEAAFVTWGVDNNATDGRNNLDDDRRNSLLLSLIEWSVEDDKWRARKHGRVVEDGRTTMTGQEEE